MTALSTEIRENPQRADDASPFSVCIVGCGNIGSAVVAMMARSQAVSTLILIDPDAYEARNLSGQCILRTDVGRPKVRAMAALAHRINPALDVVPIAARVEDVPLGAVRGVTALLSCLDSRGPRLYLNRTCQRLGIPWIDAGVDPDLHLVRVNVYRQGPDEPCLECAMSPVDYAALSARHPCDRATPDAAPTNAPASLGALAASLMVVEADKVVRGDWDDAAARRQVTFCTRTHRHVVTAFDRREDCLSGHEHWDVLPLGGSARTTTLRQVLDAPNGTTVRIAGRAFTRALVCADCGATRSVLRLESRLTAAQSRCRRCGQPGMVPVASQQLERLDAPSLSDRHLAWPLARVGLRDGDIVSVAREGHPDAHLLIGPDCAGNETSRNHSDPAPEEIPHA
ncbi:MAG: hypothetical protein CMJ18_11735 [Phycisphaeraceae bacterium]|nr:hypothetical protein [Phycisphaeraceae bacterium]